MVNIADALDPPEHSAQEPLPSTAPTEPAVNLGSWIAFASVIVSILVDLGVPLTDAQQRLVYLFMIFLAPVLTALVVRSRVYSPATVEKIVQTLQARLRGADLEASDAIARSQAVELLYPAVHTLLTHQAQAPYPYNGPQTGPQPVPADPPRSYPLLSGAEPQDPAEEQSGRFDPGYFTERTTAMAPVPQRSGIDPGFGGRHRTQ